MNYIKYNDSKYQSEGSGLHLCCPDCGKHSHSCSVEYLSNLKELTKYYCKACSQILFPILEAHECYWDACEVVWAVERFGEQVVHLKRIGAKIDRLNEGHFKQLHVQLSAWNPALGFTAGWISRASLEEALSTEKVRVIVGKALTIEDAMRAKAIRRKREEMMLPNAQLVTQSTAKSATDIIADDIGVLVAQFFMTCELAALADDQVHAHASRIHDLGTRCKLIREVLSGKTPVPKGHTRMSFATDSSCTIATETVRALRAAGKRFAKAQLVG